jgi:hypothetical protein
MNLNNKEHSELCPCDECSYDTPCQLCGNTPCNYAQRISSTQVVVACSAECFNKLKLITSMRVPQRCGGKDFICGHSGYHFGTCFVPAAIIEFHKETLDTWFEVHNHKTCIYLKSKIPQRN